MSIDLNTCKPGDKLLSKHGMILTYVEKHSGVCSKDFPHEVMYPDGSNGTRTDDGHVFNIKRLPEDHDIVEILS